MNQCNPTPQELRTLAEEKFTNTPPLERLFCTQDALLHELRVHQIELEMQNENLKQTLVELEESRKQYFDLYEFAPVGYVLLSTKGIIKNINLTGATLLGKDRSQLLNRTFGSLIGLHYRDSWHLFFWNLTRFSGRKSIEVALKRDSDAVPFYLQFDAVCTSPQNGEKSVRMTLTDITERKQLELLKHRCERYQQAEESSVNAIWEWNIRTNTIEYSNHWYKIMGYWVGCHQNTFACWENLVHPDDREAVLNRLQQHLTERTPYRAEYRFRANNGQYRWLLATGQAIWDEQGNPVRMIGTVNDITEHKEAERMMWEARQLAEKANQAKSNFLANMSHEIRTPMNAMMGMTYLIQQTELNSKQQHYLTNIDSSARLLLSLINNILDFSKIEAGKLELEHALFSLEEIVKNITHIFDCNAKEKNIALLFSIAPEVPYLLVGDALRIEQVLLNLVGNALKFADTNSEVIISVTEKEQSATKVTLQFSVCNSGAGINPEALTILFQPFSQADNSITRKYGGTGLGLAISKQLVELMEGQIWVKSDVGKETTFFFTATFGLCEYDIIESLPSESEDKSHDLHGRRVLLVEDDAINREVGVLLLTHLGVVVETAENGKQAVQRLKHETYDMVLMDIQMPEMDGFQATRLIRANKQLAALPIIAMTAYTMEDDKKEALAAGMNDYLTKPISSQKLSQMISRWINCKLPLSTLSQMPEKSYDLLPSSLPPFNITTALKRVQGNAELLHKLILMFRDNYQNICVELPTLIADGLYEEATLLAHSLKGVAMTLEIQGLSNSASMVEQALRKQDLDEIDSLIKALEVALTPAIKAASSLEAEK